MAWISVHEDVIGSKLRELACEVGCSQAEALGILNVIWLWGLKNADQTGALKCATRRNVAAAIPFDMLSDGLNQLEIVNALIKTGWVDEVDGALFLHDWDEWQEQWYKFLDRKAYDARRKQEERKRKKTGAGAGEPSTAPPAIPQETPQGEPDAPSDPPKPPKKPRKKKEEPEKKKFAEFVAMTEAEYERLIQKYGKPAADTMIEILDNYKGSKNRTYASDYRAILNWVVDRVKEKHPGLIRAEKRAEGQNENPWKGYDDG